MAQASRILITGGGTGGHVYPALAVVRALETRVSRLECFWVGSDRIESQLVPKAGVSFHRIDIRFSHRPLNRANLSYYRSHIVPLLLGRPFRQATHAVEGFRPDVILATGGYVSAPVLYAAQRQNIPYALMQMDVRPGLTNWFFADSAWKVFASTEQAALGFTGRCSSSKIVISGFPSLPPQASKAAVFDKFGISPGKKVLLVMAGSLGAAAIDRLIDDGLKLAAASGTDRRDLAVVHVIGERPGGVAPRHKPDYGAVEYCQVGYVEDMPSLMAASNFYLGRSGAATVGELLAVGIPSLLVPDPQHSDKQQLENAGLLVAKGQGTLLMQETACGQDVVKWLQSVWDTPPTKHPGSSPGERIADSLMEIWGGL